MYTLHSLQKTDEYNAHVQGLSYVAYSEWHTALNGGKSNNMIPVATKPSWLKAHSVTHDGSELNEDMDLLYIEYNNHTEEKKELMVFVFRDQERYYMYTIKVQTVQRNGVTLTVNNASTIVMSTLNDAEKVSLYFFFASILLILMCVPMFMLLILLSAGGLYSTLLCV